MDPSLPMFPLVQESENSARRLFRRRAPSSKGNLSGNLVAVVSMFPFGFALEYPLFFYVDVDDCSHQPWTWSSAPANITGSMGGSQNRSPPNPGQTQLSANIINTLVFLCAAWCWPNAVFELSASPAKHFQKAYCRGTFLTTTPLRSHRRLGQQPFSGLCPSQKTF